MLMVLTVKKKPARERVLGAVGQPDGGVLMAVEYTDLTVGEQCINGGAEEVQNNPFLHIYSGIKKLAMKCEPGRDEMYIFRSIFTVQICFCCVYIFPLEKSF